KLRWNYAADGVQQGDFKQVKVMGIEMVYIPQGDYFLGDGLANGTFRQVGNLNPAPVTQSSIIVKCNGTSYDDPQLEGAGILVDGDDGIDKDGTTAVDNPDYPMGFKAFYIMKYEISQGQWANFLNLLTPGQAQVRYYQTSSNRYTLSGNAPSIVAAAPDRACNFLSWMDGCAYADWSGLRPLTELEHEKVCRGIAAPVSGEYAWGNTSICSTAYTLANNGQPNELITNPCTNTGNASYFTTSYYYITGPLRCGICAASAVNQTRQETGASFYGVMELSGNLSERTVTLGNIAGRSYTAIHGNGMLSAEGHADVENWPGMQGVVISGAEGSGFRGGDWSYAADYLQVSSRYNAAYAYTDRNYNSGFRCGRSAP
ncbi:MAG: SUMF1/EgtB/PvdO family nonheme iron enzyme, partial [Bacteroidales bacterium]|nr:SUMF1/EgtB/PvdO family nonheme iron enzyme [Bacteroidales bacterium]